MSLLGFQIIRLGGREVDQLSIVGILEVGRVQLADDCSIIHVRLSNHRSFRNDLGNLDTAPLDLTHHVCGFLDLDAAALGHCDGQIIDADREDIGRLIGVGRGGSSYPSGQHKGSRHEKYEKSGDPQPLSHTCLRSLSLLSIWQAGLYFVTIFFHTFDPRITHFSESGSHQRLRPFIAYRI